jgi:ribosomal protein S4
MREKSRKLAVVLSSLEARKGPGRARVDGAEHREDVGTRAQHPHAASIPVPINEQLIVELYSK